MKTIKVFIASSEELRMERLEIVDVIQNEIGFGEGAEREGEYYKMKHYNH